MLPNFFHTQHLTITLNPPEIVNLEVYENEVKIINSNIVNNNIYILK